jgi:hypothetical protein
MGQRMSALRLEDGAGGGARGRGDGNDGGVLFLSAPSLHLSLLYVFRSPWGAAQYLEHERRGCKMDQAFAAWVGGRMSRLRPIFG